MSSRPGNDAPAPDDGTDISAETLDVSEGAGADRPATSDPDEHVEDSTLGGTGGTGGAG